jgi:hypothetical protein
MIIELDDNSYEVFVTKKNNKNLYIRVDEDLKIKVSCPFFYTDAMIKKILKTNEKDIIKMLLKQRAKNAREALVKEAFLGKPLEVCYEAVNRPKFDGKTLKVRDEKMLTEWYKKRAKEVFKTYLDEAYYVFEEKIPYPKLKVRKMKTRWGVCNWKDNSVTLNLELIKKDHEYLNYVIVHELSHFVHFDHGKGFWKTVEKYCPDYKRVRKELRE